MPKNMNIIKDCECEDWWESWHQIIAAQMFVITHGGSYTGEVVRYCPWCGKHLEVENTTDEQ